MKVELYVETSTGVYERLDMFEDESIVLNFKLKDTSDIGKVFSTYTQSFTVPAKSRNIKYLNFFFNPGVKINNNKKGRAINAKLYINKELFKVGYIIVNNQKNKLTNSSSINLTFFTGAGVLKDTIGDDTLSSLESDSFTMDWTDSNVINKLTNQSSVIVPLISYKRVLTYGDNGPDDIKYTSPAIINPKKVIDKDELRPAIFFSSIVNRIISKYNLDVELPLKTRPEYYKLYALCNSESVATKPSNLPIDNSTFVFSNFSALTPLWSISANSTTDEFSVSRTANSPDNQSAVFSFNFIPQDIIIGGEKDVVITFEYIDTRPTSETFDKVLYTDKITYKPENLYVISYFKIGLANNNDLNISVGNPLTFKIRYTSTAPITWSDNAYNLYAYVNNGVTPEYQYTSSNNTSNKLSPEKLRLIAMLPDMKIIDFLDSFFKMFNIRVREDNKTNKLYWETPQDFVGIEKDYSKYVDVEEVDIETQTIYKNYVFSHKMPKYKSSVDYKTANVSNVNSKEYGQLISEVNEVYAKGEYKVETKFSIIPQVLLPGAQIQTYYGFNSDAGTISGGTTTYKPNFGEFTIIYNAGVARTYVELPGDFTWTPNYAYLAVKNGSVATSISSLNYINNADEFNPNLYTNSLGFKDEVNILINNFIYEKNLYSNYYADTIASINNPNTFYYTYDCYLPPIEINEFDMRNTIIIGERKFKIEEANIDLVSGKTKLKLLNISPLLNIELPVPPLFDSMWTINGYTSPNLTFTRNYGSDNAVTVQTSTDGVIWFNSTGPATSPRNIGVLPNNTQIRLVSISDGTVSNTIIVSGTIPPPITSMWTISSYVNPNLNFVRNYGTDSSLTVQTSTDGGNNWNNSTGGTSSPRNVGALASGTLIRIQSTSDSTISNTITV